MGTGCATEYGMRQRESGQENKGSRQRKYKALGQPHRLGCEQLSKPVLEHSDATEKRGLKTGRMTRRLGDLEKQLAVCVCISKRADDAVVTIQFDRKAKPPMQPPESDVPWKKNQRQ